MIRLCIPMILCIIYKAMTWISTTPDLFQRHVLLRSVMSPYTPHFVPGFTETEVHPESKGVFVCYKLLKPGRLPLKKHPTRGFWFFGIRLGEDHFPTMNVFFSKRQMSRVKTLKKCTVTGVCLGGPIPNCVQIRSFLPVPFVSFFSMHRQPVMLHNGESDGPCSLHPSFFSV